jgi:23S rRNA (cytosine1962-C5)-methyltransferase
MNIWRKIMEFSIYPKVVLKKGREESDSRKHPWIFSGAIESKDSNIKPGDYVKVESSKNAFIGIGTYSSGSIAVRILSWIDLVIDKNFFAFNIKKAKELRESLEINSNSYRLIHGEGDNLSGLIIDKYDNVFVVQAHDEGIYLNINLIKDALIEVFGKDIVVYNKSSKTIPFLKNIKDEFLYGNEIEYIEIIENGNKFIVDFIKGQKSGFFIDQRENRYLLSNFSKNKDVLNTFAYTGGFSIYALNGGAKSCVSVDGSEYATELINKNIELNNYTNKHTTIKKDIFKFFESNEDKFDLVVVDPPAFAKHQKAKKQALNAYTRINLMAIESLQEDGIIFTFSCSQAISEEDFQRAIFNAVLQTNRKCSILYKLSQPADHPRNIFHPEGKYLKGFVLKFD